jgi:hypothetical protein
MKGGTAVSQRECKQYQPFHVAGPGRLSKTMSSPSPLLRKYHAFEKILEKWP